MRTFLFLLCFSLFIGPLAVFAAEPVQQEAADQTEEEEAAPEIPTSRPEEAATQYVYEQPTMEALSKLYWALSRLDTSNNKSVDNYMLINECELYKDYAKHEFEWEDVRESARQYLKANKNKFSLRLEFMQPIKLGEYDIDKKTFDVLEDYRIDGTRRFELQATNTKGEICGVQGQIEGYPRAILMELSRPYMLQYLPVFEEIANEYISQKHEEFRKMPLNMQTDANLYEMRDAYLVMKVKFFASGGQRINQDGVWLAELQGVLEGIEIYGDKEKKLLMYSKDYVRKRKRSQMEEKLRAEYEMEKLQQGEKSVQPIKELKQ